jgi:class 3 adenylate cyclase
LALEIQEALADFAERVGEPLSMRVGINSGPVVAGEIEIKGKGRMRTWLLLGRRASD